MSVDWDALLLDPLMSIFGEGDRADQSTWPIYTPRGQASFRLADAVFDPAYLHTSIGADEEPATTRRPVLGVRAALFARFPAQGDRVQILAGADAGTYLVIDVQQDGHGHVLLILAQAAA